MNKSKKYSDLTIERFVLGELPADLTKEISSTMENNPELKNKIDFITDQNKKFNELSNHNRIKDNILNQLKPPPFFPVLKFAAAMGMAVIVIAVTYDFYGKTPSQVNDFSNFKSFHFGTDRIKGSSGFSIYRQRDGKTEKLNNNDSAAEGDVVEVKIESRQGYGVVVSIDGRANVTLHFPEHDGDSTSLSGPHPQRAYMLDDAPDFERFIFIQSDKPIKTSDVINTVKSLNDIKNVKRIFINKPDITENSVILNKKRSNP